MGTRGFVGFVADGRETFTYNHFDSYPSGVGTEVLAFARTLAGDSETEERYRNLAREIKHVSDATPPTREQVVELAQFADLNVSKGNLYEEWYGLLRNTQGNPALILGCGYAEHDPDFPRDSLWCEWGYLIDFDRRVFEVYEGFQQSPPTAGRWADVTPPVEATSAGYHPVNRVAVFNLDDLPTDEEFVAKLESEDA